MGRGGESDWKETWAKDGRKMYENTLEGISTYIKPQVRMFSLIPRMSHYNVLHYEPRGDA